MDAETASLQSNRMPRPICALVWRPAADQAFFILGSSMNVIYKQLSLRKKDDLNNLQETFIFRPNYVLEVVP
jgi:hypothetical protein